MINWRKQLVSAFGILLVLLSRVVYGLRISETIQPAGGTPAHARQITRQYSLDRLRSSREQTK